jgi:hypothetical protein
VPTVADGSGGQAAPLAAGNFQASQLGRNQMPVILWLLGVPLVVVVLLMLFHVI